MNPPRLCVSTTNPPATMQRDLAMLYYCYGEFTCCVTFDPSMDAKHTKLLSGKVSKSKLFRDYEQAFSETTRLPLSFHPVETWQLAQHGKKHENPFCALLAESSRSCSECLENQQKISDAAIPANSSNSTKSSVCFAGFTDSTVPVHLGESLIGFLQTGQVALKKPSAKKFKKIASQLVDWGIKTDLTKLEHAYFHTQVLAPRAYQSILRLLEVFAQHLSLAIDQVAVQEDHSEAPQITRAKKFIEEQNANEISLVDVAKVVNVSTFYFCKMFKKATGLTFTQYLSHVRISKAKNLLLNPNLRISEIAFDVGYQSITHFNRTFHNIAGISPTEYRRTVKNELPLGHGTN